MRNVRFNLWHMLLVVALVLGTITAIFAGIQAFIPQFHLPWLLPLLAVAATDAVITQRIAARERLSLGEQATLRTVEWTLLIVAIRLASLSAEGTRLLDVLQPWLRDPLAFFGGFFATYFWPTLITWVLSTVVAQSVLSFEAELPHSSVRSSSSEEAVVLEDRALALARFDRYWLSCTLAALTGAALALYQMPLITALQAWTTARPVLAVFACLIAGLALHSQGQLDRLRYGWQLQQTRIAADVPRRWRRSSAILISVACVVGLLLSQATLWVPPLPVVPILNALLVVAAFIVALIVALFGLLLFPFAWLLAYLAGNSLPATPIFRPIPPPQIAAPPTDRPLLPALIFWICVVLLLGLALLRYVQQRQDLRALVGRWRGVAWLLRIFGVAWHDLRDWSALALRTIGGRLRRSGRLPQPRTLPPDGAAAQLRVIYRRMVRSAERRGIQHPRSQTPYEFRAALGTALPPADTDVGGLTDVYVAAEYGPQPVRPADVRRARRHWLRVKQLIARSQRSIRPLSLKRHKNK